MRITPRSTLLSVFLLLPVATQAQDAGLANVNATTGSKQVTMVQATDAPRIDGLLDEDLWQRAAVISDFHQMNPVEYGEPLLVIE